MAKWREQLAEAVRVKQFPVLTWMLAGSCLIILYAVDMPNRQRQRLQRDADAALQREGASPTLDIVQVLPNGKLLLRDGAVVDKTRR